MRKLTNHLNRMPLANSYLRQLLKLVSVGQMVPNKINQYLVLVIKFCIQKLKLFTLNEMSVLVSVCLKKLNVIVNIILHTMLIIRNKVLKL